MSNKNKKIIILSSRSGGPFRQYLIISKEMRKNGFNVELYNDFWSWIKLHFTYGKNIFIITNVPFLFRFPNSNFYLNIKGNYKKERHPKRNPLGYLYGINKLWSKKIIVPCQYLKEKLNIKDAVVINNAITNNLINNEEKSKREDDPIRLIMVTKFYFKEKAEGVLRVISALSKIKTVKNIRLDIFGYGYFEKEIFMEADKIKLAQNIKVHFNGKSDNIYGEYQKSDIFVYWSNLDVMPNVFLEAMAFGLPIIVNNFPSFGEILGKHNVIAENESIFAKSLEDFINNSEKMKSVGDKNREWVKRFSTEKILNKWIDIIFAND